LSEQALKTPARISKLIDVWSEIAVRIIWSQGGVFDKMVGDCVIGLWGPPFFDLASKDMCARAARAANAIREATDALNDSDELPEIREALSSRADARRIAVSVGLNYCSLSVGSFGPNSNYTGFSSGMNNAARLEGVAGHNEVLCLENFCTVLDREDCLGEWRQQAVKNVQESLRFRELLRGAQLDSVV
jgi:adenylate cyclase